MKTPETSPEYDAFKALLAKIVAVPNAEIVKREAEYKRDAKLKPRRGPKLKSSPKDS